MNNIELFNECISLTENNRNNEKQKIKERVMDRLNLPIGTSSTGIVCTKEMNDQIIYLQKYFNM